MSDTGRRAAMKRYPAFANRPAVIIPLMHFGETFGELVPDHAARRQLGLDTKLRMILMLGQIRRYKNVPELIRVFRGLADADTRLFVVGNPHDPDLVREIEDLAIDPRITLSLRAATIDEIKTYMAAATLVVAPYQEILNSGSALLGLTHHRPVLLPNRGAMAELQSAVGPEWIRLYEPPLSCRELDAALEWATEPRVTGPDLSRFAPDRIVEAHADAFSMILRPDPTGVQEKPR